jgi:hypothetical protein
MERLEEYKADRKSKSLEESKGENFLRGINPSTYLTENDIRSACIYGEGKWAT